MNALIYNYKFLVTDVKSHNIIEGYLDFGFRIVQNRTIALAGIRSLPPQEAKTDDGRAFLRQATDVVGNLLLPRDRNTGRLVIVSPTDPAKSGKVKAEMYIPCLNLSDKHPTMTSKRARFNLLNVTQCFGVLEKGGFSLDLLDEIVAEVGPYDMPL